MLGMMYVVVRLRFLLDEGCSCDGFGVMEGINLVIDSVRGGYVSV